jgi:hypothetical protein
MWVNYTLFGVLVSLNMLDYFLTEQLLARGGVEKNPVAAWLIARGGVELLALVKAVLLLALGLLLAHVSPWVLLGLVGFYGWVVYHNRTLFKAFF